MSLCLDVCLKVGVCGFMLLLRMSFSSLFQSPSLQYPNDDDHGFVEKKKPNALFLSLELDVCFSVEKAAVSIVQSCVIILVYIKYMYVCVCPWS